MASTNKDKLKELLGKIAVSTNTITVEEDINHYTVLELLNALRSNVKEINKILDDKGLDKNIIAIYEQSLIPFNIERAKGLKVFPARDGKGKPFTQGFAINQERDELYVSRQLNNGTEVEIHIWKYSTMTKKGMKKYTKSTGAYQEGCPYFINQYNQLVFLVRTTYNNYLALFNWDTGQLSNAFSVLGGSKVAIDSDRKYFITSMGDASHLEGVYIYDLQSIIDMQPVLLRTVRFPLSIRNGNKTQGLTMINGLIYLSQGASNGYPSIVVLNQAGQVLNQVVLDKRSLASKMSSYLDATEYENEGINYIKIDGVCYPVINHIFSVDTCCLMIHGNAEDSRVEEGTNLVLSNELEWLDLPLKDGISSYGVDVKPQYAKDEKGFVYLRGVVTHTPLTPQSGSTLDLAQLGFPYRPERNCFFYTVGSGYADKQNRIEIKRNGTIILTDTVSGSPTPFTCLDGIFFYSERS